MGDERHKRSPIKAEPRKVTQLFVQQVVASLAANKVHNTKNRLSKGENGYRPESHQDISDEIDCDPNAIKNLLGGVRAGTKAKRPRTSRLVDPICKLLGIERMIGVDVPASLVPLVLEIAAMPLERRIELAEFMRSK